MKGKSNVLIDRTRYFSQTAVSNGYSNAQSLNDMLRKIMSPFFLGRGESDSVKREGSAAGSRMIQKKNQQLTVDLGILILLQSSSDKD